MTAILKFPRIRHPDRRAKIVACIWLVISPAWLAGAADEGGEKGDDETEKAPQTIAKVLEQCDTRDGLFPLHQDRKDGTVYLEVAADQLGPEFIHFSHTLDGVTDLGLFRGQFSRSRVITIRRHFDRIEFVEHNTGFHFRPDSALRRASDANISEAVLASLEIAAEDEEADRFLVEAGGLFLEEFFRQLKSGESDDDEEKKDRFRLGELSDDRTRFVGSETFPDNTLFRVRYVFENLHPEKTGDEDVTDSRFVSIEVQHTLMEMPDNGYEPRFADPRVGYFTTRVTDLTSKSSAPYRDLVHRWRLRKKNPDAEVSPPVEPITWWIENTTPEELRDVIRDAVLAWNAAFESAGIRDALEVKVQPDDAEWDADDVRYHVLRWTSSPDPPFGGYGPSFVNPRTGQILGADIMLEYIFLTNRIRFRELVDLGRPEPAAARPRLPGGSSHFCGYGHCLHADRIAAGAVLRATRDRFGNGPVDLDELVRQSLADLVMHEIGHTLGLSHNFRASQLYDRERIHDTELTAETGVAASVMDYTPINLAADPREQGHYCSIVPGPYDHWAIRFGYDDEEDLSAILGESTRPEHAFANDADDMRAAGRGIDPRVMINDLTSEPIAHAVDRIELVEATLPKLAGQFPVEGESYHELRTAFSTLMRLHDRAAETMSRYVGGVYVDRSLHGQEGGWKHPFIPVPAARQREAMARLSEHVFGPDAFAFPPDLLARLQLERRGFEFFELDANEDPKVHERVLAIQANVLDHLLHPHTLARIVDTRLYGNEYPLGAVMTDLDTAIMDGDPGGRVGSFREALQLDYVERLIAISGLTGKSEHPPAARSQAVLLLEKRLEDGKLPAAPERHARHLRRLIRNALESR